MLKNTYLSRSIMDASWASFTAMLSYKAESAGSRVVAVNPKNTSKKCSNCSNIQDMPLQKREYNCSKCNLNLDRDINAARNILRTALNSCYAVGLTVNACKEKTSTPSGASVFNEAGTINQV